MEAEENDNIEELLWELLMGVDDSPAGNFSFTVALAAEDVGGKDVFAPMCGADMLATGVFSTVGLKAGDPK